MKKKYFLLFSLLGFLISCSYESINEPTLTISDFSKTIDENPDENGILGTIEAQTNQGKLTFSIVNQTPNDAMEIDSNTGVLKVLNKSLFDYENNKSITGTIRVQNGELFKTINVTINLKNVVESRVLKKITETNSEFIVELFVLRNEVTEFCKTLTDDSFTSFTSGTQSYTYHQQLSGAIYSYRHNPQNKNEYLTIIPKMFIGGNYFTYPWNFENTYKSLDEGHTVYKDDILISYNAELPITTISISNLLKKENSQFNNILYRKLILKKTKNDNTPLPSNLWVSLHSGTGSVYENSKEVLRVEAVWWAKFNGTTWEEQNTDVFGNKIQTIPSFCN